jgi:RNA polymerase sigma factor (sigma-70 family)
MTQVKLKREIATDSLAAYLDEIGRRPLLTAEEEVMLAKQIEDGRQAAAELEAGVPPGRRAGLEVAVRRGERARATFLESNVRLVVSIAKRYRNGVTGIDMLDLIQEGNLGLMRAVDKFEWRKGFKFSTYATWWIRQAISRALQEKGRPIRLPPRVHDAALRVKATAAELHAESGRTPSLEEIAERSGLEERRVEEVLKLGDVSSLEAPIGDDGAQLADFIVTDDDPSPEHEALESEKATRLRAVVERLNPREQLILRHRFGLNDGEPRTRVEIGEILGLTPERIGQIERAALCRIRHPSFGLLEKDFD